MKESLFIALVVSFGTIGLLLLLIKDYTGQYPKWYRNLPSAWKRGSAITFVALIVIAMGKYPMASYKAPEEDPSAFCIRLGYLILLVALWEAIIRPIIYTPYHKIKKVVRIISFVCTDSKGRVTDVTSVDVL